MLRNVVIIILEKQKQKQTSPVSCGITFITKLFNINVC